ncbi:TcpE family conjugal transfer membrane protein, partial [Allosalinactinospora lopnorensis]|uniref:TcpE family conjugal transfer membrane protein n=1 Tax=Allosalinactinospora lopnorensis TaxID=1352348 RepID=UPI000695F51C
MNEPNQTPDQPYALVGRSYTKARRHPWVIGKIQGWTLPMGPFTATQLGVLAVGLYLLAKTWPLWSHLGPFAVIVIAAPIAATWAVRHATIEGRTPLRALTGYLALLTAPRTGWMHGRPVTEPRPEPVHGVITIAPPQAPETGHDQRRRRTAPRAARPSRPTTLQQLLSE